MSENFIRNNLMPDESIVYQSCIHWFIYFSSFFWLLVALAIYWFGKYQLGIDSMVVEIFTLLFVFIAIWKFGAAFIHKTFTEVAITDRRMMAKFGWIARETIEIPLMKVESVLIDQTVIERIVSSGSLAVRGTGTSMAPIRFMDEPVKFRNQLNQAIADARIRYSGGGNNGYHGGPEQQ